MLSRSLGRREPSDDEVIGIVRFDLEPVFRPGLLILTFFELRNNTLKAVFGHSGEELFPGAFDVIGESNPASVCLDHFPENGLSIDQRKLHQVIAVEVNQIECIEVNGDLLIRGRDVFRPRQVTIYEQLDCAALGFFLHAAVPDRLPRAPRHGRPEQRGSA